MGRLVDHPSHYNAEGRKECIVEMEEKYGFVATATFCLLSAYKYLYRAGEKEGNSEAQDVAKAKWYFEWVTYNMFFHGCYGLNMDLYRDIEVMLNKLTG